MPNDAFVGTSLDTDGFGADSEPEALGLRYPWRHLYAHVVIAVDRPAGGGPAQGDHVDRRLPEQARHLWCERSLVDLLRRRRL